jgi:hypothetical protein
MAITGNGATVDERWDNGDGPERVDPLNIVDGAILPAAVAAVATAAPAL